jgi:ABC-type sugar transport system permease subunit
MKPPTNAPRPTLLVLFSLCLVGMAAALEVFEALRGTGILRQPVFLAGVALAAVAGLGLLAWMVRRDDSFDRGVERISARLSVKWRWPSGLCAC